MKIFQMMSIKSYGHWCIYQQSTHRINSAVLYIAATFSASCECRYQLLISRLVQKLKNYNLKLLLKQRTRIVLCSA